jgi:hypothetical protein
MKEVDGKGVKYIQCALKLGSRVIMRTKINRLRGTIIEACAIIDAHMLRAVPKDMCYHHPDMF